MIWYAPVATKQYNISDIHLLRMYPTFSKSERSLLWYWNSVI